MVLHEKGARFETREVDLENKSEEFLSVSPTGKVPAVVIDGHVLHESNVVNEFFDEVLPDPPLLPGDPVERAHARIWMASADANFYPAVFVSSVGRERGFSEGRIAEGRERLEAALDALEVRLGERKYLAGEEFSLADIAHAGNFVRLREVEGRGETSLETRPNVAAWVRRIEGRESYELAQ